MAGMDARTGKALDGFDHVQQSLEKLFSTPQGEQVMREWFGNPGTRLLGENITQRTIVQWCNIVWMLCDLFEPRFRVRRFVPVSADRAGTFDMKIEGEYRPYAHLDFEQAVYFVSVRDGVVSFSTAQ